MFDVKHLVRKKYYYQNKKYASRLRDNMKANLVSRICMIQMKFTRPVLRVRLFVIQKAVPEGLSKKTSKLGLNELGA